MAGYQLNEIIEATCAGDIDRVRRVLAGGANPDARPDDEPSALMWAIMLGYCEIAKLLLDAGADPDQADPGGTTPLGRVASSTDGTRSTLLALLLTAGVETSGPAATESLCSAAFAGNLDVVSQLLTAGAEVNGWYRSEEGESTPLMSAVVGGHPEVVGVLINAGADVRAADSAGRTALHACAERTNDPRIVELLLDAGAPADGVAPITEAPTPLISAVAMGHLHLVTALLRHGADPTPRHPVWGTAREVAERRRHSTSDEILAALQAVAVGRTPSKSD